MKNKLVVKQLEEAPVERPVLAQAIVNMSNAVEHLKKSGINFEAIVILTQHHCRPVGKGYMKSKPSAKDVRAVLESLEDLKRFYTK